MVKWYAFAGFWIGFVVGILFFHAILGNADGMIDPSTPNILNYPPAIKQNFPDGDLYLRHDIEEYIRYKFGVDGEKALRIAYCESNLNVNALHVNRNGTVDRGLWQINTVHKTITNECAFNARCSTDAAHALYMRQGFTPWVCK